MEKAKRIDTVRQNGRESNIESANNSRIVGRFEGSSVGEVVAYAVRKEESDRLCVEGADGVQGAPTKPSPKNRLNEMPADEQTGEGGYSPVPRGHLVENPRDLQMPAEKGPSETVRASFPFPRLQACR